MPASTPEQINDLFIEYMRRGDLDAVLTLYEPEAAFASRSGDVKRGQSELREQLRGFAEAKRVFRFEVKKVVQTGDLALVHNVWAIESLPEMSGYALEVARRQSDGTWRWAIGDPFTVASYTTLRES